METSIYKQFYELEQKHWWFQGMYAICQDILKKHTRLTLSGTQYLILDVGCGTGFWPQSLLNYGKVFTLDSAPQSLNICRKQDIRYLIQSNAEFLPFADNSFDLVTALGLIEHLDNDREFLGEVRRVLKPGGYGLLLTSAYMFLWGVHDDLVHHRRRYTQQSLTKMINKTGLKIIKITYVNTFLFLPIMLMRLKEKIRFLNKNKYTNSPDLFLIPQMFNQLLYGLLKVESWILKRISLPFGVGLLVLIHK